MQFFSSLPNNDMFALRASPSFRRTPRKLRRVVSRASLR
jgi:hypothetical protein